jgi:O-antigen/teichoic acid export membrane protein
MELLKRYPLKNHLVRLYDYFMGDSLRRSSSFLLLSSGVGAVFGFAFWLICAHLSSSDQIGFAATLMAYVSLISTITTLGLSNAVVRFLPHHNNKDSYFSTVMGITLASSLIIGALLLESIRFLSPKLGFAIANPEIFGMLLLIVVLSSIGSIADASLLAQKDAKTIFIKALWLYPVRVILPFIFAALRLENLLFIFAISTIIGTEYEFYVLFKKHHRINKANLASLSDSYKFTLGNFTGTIFGIFPATLVPIIVLNKLGPKLAAYFYIAMQFASLLSIISSSSAQAYLSEASNDKEGGREMYHFVKASRNLFALLVPAAVLMALIGSQILRFYGPGYYSHGAVPLIILCVSSLFIGVNWLGDSLLNVQKRPFAYGAMNFINALLVVAIVYEVASKGLVSIGVASLMAQALTVLIYMLLQYKFISNYSPAKPAYTS